MDTIVALCHHSSHEKILDSFLKQFSSNWNLKFMTIPDTLYEKGVTQIDYEGSIGDSSTYSSISDNSVRAYINVFCGQRIPNIENGFQEIDRTLKSGGLVVFSKLMNGKQPLNDMMKTFFEKKGYTLRGPLHVKIFENQPDPHVNATEWYVLQKPNTSGKRQKTKRSKRKARKTYRK